MKGSFLNKCRELTLELFLKKKEIKRLDSEVRKLTRELVKVAGEAFEENSIDNKICFTFPAQTLSHNVADMLVLRRIQNTKVVFDADSVEFVLSKENGKRVISKQYTITDMDGLIKYLKSCGVNPQEFKKYISVTKSVDNKELEKLEELGEISLEDLEGCYDVIKSEPYFKISAKKGQGEIE